MLWSMDQKNLINKLRLIRTPNIGPITCQLLMRRYGSAAAALEAVPDLSARVSRQLKLATKQQVEQEIEQASKLGRRLSVMEMMNIPLHY